MSSSSSSSEEDERERERERILVSLQQFRELFPDKGRGRRWWTAHESADENASIKKKKKDSNEEI